MHMWAYVCVQVWFESHKYLKVFQLVAMPSLLRPWFAIVICVWSAYWWYGSVHVFVPYRMCIRISSFSNCGVNKCHDTCDLSDMCFLTLWNNCHHSNISLLRVGMQLLGGVCTYENSFFRDQKTPTGMPSVRLKFVLLLLHICRLQFTLFGSRNDSQQPN